MSFSRLDSRDITISADTVTAPVWSSNTPTATAFITSSAQQVSSTSQYYSEVYLSSSLFTDVQFSIAYADKLGYGTTPFNAAVPANTPSSVVYGQMKNLVLGEDNESFVFGDYTAEYFYAISIDRARYKEKLMPATFNLTLATSTGEISLTDNSKEVSVDTYKEAGRVFEVVSGSNGEAYSGTGYTTASGSYGWFLPDVGLILLNGAALDGGLAAGGVGLGTDRGATTPTLKNQNRLYNAIDRGESFSLNSEETITSTYVFCRVRSDEFNYSTNPSMITGSTGDIRHTEMINSPRTYITSVGLYNDNNDLVAVAKLSKPLQKDFTKEALVRIKLDY